MQNTLSTSWHSYPKVWSLGHPFTADIFKVLVSIEEKIDGSQFSFGIFDGELKIRSKGTEMIFGKEKMFSKAEAFVLSVKDILTPGYTYRCEYLSKPDHNINKYLRTPKNNLMIIDINSDFETYLPFSEKQKEAERLGLECVPLLFQGMVENVEALKELLNKESVLGGCKIEGFVVKNYIQFGPDSKAILGKYVSEQFKETHKNEWKTNNPEKKEIVDMLISVYRTEARWDKAIIHLRESGLLENSPKDIPLLIKSVGKDVVEECKEEILDLLWEWVQPKLTRGVVRGLPEFYKSRILEGIFKD